MHKDHDKVGTGDIHFQKDTTEIKSESAHRHREFDDASQPEIRSTQLMPGPLDEGEEETEVEIQPQTLKWNQETKHTSR